MSNIPAVHYSVFAEDRRNYTTYWAASCWECDLAPWKYVFDSVNDLKLIGDRFVCAGHRA